MVIYQQDVNNSRKDREKIMDKIISTYNYGICLFSVDVLNDFIKEEKIRSKKILELFQKDKNRYLISQKEGVWIPLAQIDSGEYIIKIEGFDEIFGDEWELKFEYEGFNIAIRDGLWISDIGSLLTFDPSVFCGTERTFEDGDGTLLYSDFRYNIPHGKYLVKIKGYVRKQLLEYPNSNYGYLFSLNKVDEFHGYKNSREDIYNFNVSDY